MILKDTLLYLSQNERVHEFVVQNQLARKVSHRFVAGETLDAAIEATRELNKKNMQVALNYLGESVFDASTAQAAAQDYISAIERIKQAGVNANISIKLTALGLDISEELCEQNLHTILARAQQYSIFVAIDMEGSAYTEQTINITLRAHQQYEHVGTVLQAYLLRTRRDIEQLIAHGVRTRLVKGAYKEPSSIAYQQKREVDRNYVHLMSILLAQGNFPAIATHDEEMIKAACKFARDRGISKDAFEFQMLYGVRRDLQELLVNRGYNMRVYVPYGSHWYPYLMRRLAERPANLVFIMSNAMR